MGLSDEAKRSDDDARGYLRSTVGDVVGFALAGVTVNLDGLEVTMPNVGAVRPIPGESVRVLFTGDGTFLCVGPVKPRAATGTITAVVAGVSVNVLGDDGVTYPGLPYNPADTLTNGDLVALDWSANGYVLGRQSGLAAPGGGVTPPPAPPTPTSGTTTFTARDSGSWYTPGGRWSTNDVWYGSSNLGAWFYGTKIRDTLRGATATAASIYLPVLSASGSDTLVLGRHPHASRPAGAPSVGGGVGRAGAKSSGWFPLPLAVAQYLIDNRGAGVATYGAGARLFAGTAKNRDSGKLRITWRK